MTTPQPKPADESRQLLLDRARGGDVEALGELFESFRPYIAFIARARGAKQLQAKVGESDLVQDTLVNAHRAFASFRGTTIEEFAGWLRQIANRATGQMLRDQLDAEKRDARREQAGERLSGIAEADGSTPSGRLMDHETSARIARAIADLPDDMQLVLLGRHVEQFPYEELARRLQKTEAAVRVIYTRALRRIRDAVES